MREVAWMLTGCGGGRGVVEMLSSCGVCTFHFIYGKWVILLGYEFHSVTKLLNLSLPFFFSSGPLILDLLVQN